MPSSSARCLVADVMEEALRRAFVGGAVEGLFGSGPERAIAAFRSFCAEGSHPATIIESPLLGATSYDVLVGSYGDSLNMGVHLPEASPPVCHAAFDWAASLDQSRNIDLFFEQDANGQEGRCAGIHCRHWGDLDAVQAFYEAIGESWRAPLYRNIAEKLPARWRAVFAAAFKGRPGVPTRLEMAFADDERTHIGNSPAYLASCFDQIGFSAYDDRMLEDICRLASISLLNTFQFDILADGSLGTTFSITSCFERTGTDFARLFLDDGTVGTVCGTYERMGVADGRWRLAEKAVFATKKVAVDGAGLCRILLASIPNCGKAKWIDARPQPAKLYLLQGALVDRQTGQRNQSHG